MNDQRRFTWISGGLISTPITDFWQISTTVQDPSIPNLPLETPTGGGSTAYSLSGTNGAYTQTGQTAVFSVGRNLAGTNGSYSLAGQVTTLSLARHLAGDAGAYTFAGQDATLTYTPGATATNYELAGDFGAYAFLGQDADLSILPGYSPAPIDIQVSLIPAGNLLYLNKKRKKRRAFLLLG